MDINDLRGKRVVILAGGESSERDVSFRSAKNVQKALENLGINAPIVDFCGDNIRDFVQNPPDLAVIMMHGRPGEDGTVQGFLEMLKIPYTGSGVVASAVGIDKYIFKLVCRGLGVRVPDFVLIRDYDGIDKAFGFAERVGYPVIIKPRREGSSVGTKICKNPDDLRDALKENLKTFGDTLVEKYIKGKEITVGVLGTGRNAFALPILELRVKKREFYDYVAKYTKGETEFIIPAELPEELYKKAQDTALLLHREIDCKGFSRVDFIATDGDVFALEINTIPGMTELSDLPAEAKHMGLSYEDVVVYILKSAYE
ncbi:MAG: D-alanine--D-alanine ligase [candidate division WOR-3 bacterium]